MNEFQVFVGFWSGWLIHSGWQSAIVVALAAILLRMTRSASAQFRYAILMVALLKFAVPPFMSLPGGLFTQSRLPLDSTFAVEINASIDVKENTESGGDPSTAPGDQSNDSGVSIAPKLADSSNRHDLVNRKKSATTSNENRLLTSLLLVHATGVLVASFFILRQYKILRRLVQRSVPASAEIVQLARQTADALKMRTLPPVLISSECDSPFATGLIWPVVLLPQPL